jgi:hypothetical protein
MTLPKQQDLLLAGYLTPISKVPHDKLGSYSGWIVYGKISYASNFMTHYLSFLKKFKKFKNVTIFIGKLMTLYNTKRKPKLLKDDVSNINNPIL